MNVNREIPVVHKPVDYEHLSAYLDVMFGNVADVRDELRSKIEGIYELRDGGMSVVLVREDIDAEIKAKLDEAKYRLNQVVDNIYSAGEMANNKIKEKAETEA